MPPKKTDPEPETFTISAEQALAAMQQLYPTEFAHVVATLEAQYWKDKATSND